MARTKKRSTRFSRELVRQTRLAVAAAIGFLIAYSWKEYVFGIAKSFMGGFIETMPNLSNFGAAMIISIVGVIFILISSRLLD